MKLHTLLCAISASILVSGCYMARDMAESMGAPEQHTGRVVQLGADTTPGEFVAKCGRDNDQRICTRALLTAKLQAQAEKECHGYTMHYVRAHEVRKYVLGGNGLRYDDFANVDIDCPVN